MKDKFFLLLATVAVNAAAASAAVVPLADSPSAAETRRVNEIYSRMSQPERVAQLQSRFMDDLFDAQGQLDTAQCRRLIPYGIGHFSQYASQLPLSANVLRDRVAAIQQWLMRHTPTGIPALFHEEVLSGINARDATVYPQQIGLSCSFNPQLAERKTLQTGRALRRMGGVLSLSPMVDVCRNPSFNRLEESYGEDAYLSAVLGTAFVRGLQAGGLKRGVSACSKHYLGYGGGDAADEKELMEEILMPHEAMIRLAGSKVVMPGYHAVHGTKCVANGELLTDILRGYVGFDGMVVSDYNAIDQIPGLPGPMQRAAAAINGGNDVDFPVGSNYATLPEALQLGLVGNEAFERAVKNVLRHKLRCGLFDSDAYLYSPDDIRLDSPEERRTAYELATQSVVLLENRGVLPLRGRQTVLLTGPNAHSMWAMCGDYSFQSMSYFWKKTDVGPDCPHIVTLNEGMTRRAPSGVSVLYSRGCDWTEEIETRYQELGDERAWEYGILHRKVDSGQPANADEALALAKGCDVIVAAMGENVMLCGENRDRRGLRLPGSQEAYVRRLIATGKPVVLVVFGGRAQVLGNLADECAAVVQAWYPGEEGGNAVADMLYGLVSPSGKLSVSYPRVELDSTLCYNRSTQADPRVQWPFGHGLSYTTFRYANLRVAPEARTTDEALTLSFDVTNTGGAEATETAQLYLSPTRPSQPLRPIQLQGFARVHLAKGQTKTVSIRLYTEQMGHYTREGGRRRWRVEPGAYTLKLGASSADIRLQQDVVLKGRAVEKPLREHYFSVTTVPE